MAHRRFGPNFAQYYEERQMVEQWLFENLKKIGGNPQSKHPLYFVFQHTENPVFDFGDTQSYKLNFNDIACEDVSFSLGFCPKSDLLKLSFGITTIAINNLHKYL